MKLLRSCYLLLMLAALSGCIGASDYSCKGVPDGAMCLSVKDTYAVTNSSDYKTLIAGNKESSKNNGQTSEISEAVLQSYNISVPEQAVRSLDGSHAVPVLVPAEVMRVWYGPYGGMKGLASIMPGVGYIELTPRKWVFSKQNQKMARQIQPLHVNTAMNITSGNGDQKPTGLNDLNPELPSQQKGKTTTKEKKK